MDHDSSAQERQPWHYFPVIAAALMLGAVIASFTLAAYFALDVLVILILALLFGVLLTKLSNLLSHVTSLGRKTSLALVVAGLLLLIVACLALFGARISSQLSKADQQIQQTQAFLLERLRESATASALLSEVPVVRDWLESLLSQERSDQSGRQDGEPRSGEAGGDPQPEASTAPDQEISSSREDAGATDRAMPTSDQTSDQTSTSSEEAQGSSNQNSTTAGSSEGGSVGSAVSSLGGRLIRLTGSLLTTTFGLVVNGLLIMIVGLFLASSPDRMRDGVVVLVPPVHRDETRRVMNKIGDCLWQWLLGRMASMLVTGLGVGVALWALGVPLASLLGIATGLLTFVPNIGAAIALMLAIFVALPSGLSTVGLVVAVYIGFQLIESYALTPLIDQHQVDLPPAVVISSQAVLGVLLGFLGAMVASPVMVVLLVLRDEVYLRHLLKTPVTERAGT